MSSWLDVSVFKRNTSYALVYSGQFISFLGTMMTMVAMPFQIYEATHSSFDVGLLSLIELMPLLVTALLGGVLADRHSRRRLLLLSEVSLVMVCVLLALNASMAHKSVVIVFVAGAFMSAISGLHRPSFSGLMQQLVNDKDYKTVGALQSFQFSFGLIAGPSMAGLIIATWGVAVTYWIDVFTFLCAIVTLIALKPVPHLPQARSLPVLAALKEGIHFAWSRPVLLGSYCVDFLAMVFAMPRAIFPAIALQLSGVKTLGCLYAAPAVGALFVSLASGWTGFIQKEGQAVAYAALGWGGAIIAFGYAHSVVWSLFFLAIAGAADAISGIFRMSLWNHTIPQELRGRLAGIEMLSYLSGPKLGDMRAGMMANAFGLAPAIVSGGVFCMLSVSLCCYYLKDFWNYQRTG